MASDEFIDITLCRICQIENGFENIFEKQENIISYAQIITFCTSVQVNEIIDTSSCV